MDVRIEGEARAPAQMTADHVQDALMYGLVSSILLGLSALLLFHKELGNVLADKENINWKVVGWSSLPEAFGVGCGGYAIYNGYLGWGSPKTTTSANNNDTTSNADARPGRQGPGPVGMTAAQADEICAQGNAVDTEVFVGHIETICSLWEGTDPIRQWRMWEYFIGYTRHAEITEVQKARIETAVLQYCELNGGHALKFEPQFANYPKIAAQCMRKVSLETFFNNAQFADMDTLLFRCKEYLEQKVFTIGVDGAAPHVPNSATLRTFFTMSGRLNGSGSVEDKHMAFWKWILNSEDVIRKPFMDAIWTLKAADPKTIVLGKLISDLEAASNESDVEQWMGLALEEKAFEVEDLIKYAPEQWSLFYAYAVAYRLELLLHANKGNREKLLIAFLPSLQGMPEGPNKKALCVALFSSRNLLDKLVYSKKPDLLIPDEFLEARAKLREILNKTLRSASGEELRRAQGFAARNGYEVKYMPDPKDMISKSNIK